MAPLLPLEVTAALALPCATVPVFEVTFWETFKALAMTVVVFAGDALAALETFLWVEASSLELTALTALVVAVAWPTM